MSNLEKLVNLLRWDDLDLDIQNLRQENPEYFQLIWDFKDHTYFVSDILIRFRKNALDKKLIDILDSSKKENESIYIPLYTPSNEELENFINNNLEEISKDLLMKFKSVTDSCDLDFNHLKTIISSMHNVKDQIDYYNKLKEQMTQLKPIFPKI